MAHFLVGAAEHLTLVQEKNSGPLISDGSYNLLKAIF